MFQTLRYLLRQRLSIERPVTYIDATNLRPEERRPYLEIGQQYGCGVKAVFFDVPLEVCLERNAGRGRVVPEDVLAKMAEKLTPFGCLFVLLHCGDPAFVINHDGASTMQWIFPVACY